jgi:ABC-type sugar transport system ATPase subunit
MASVAFDHVEKVYPGGVVALADLCLEAPDGELLALVGPSGCGKSTVLRLLAGLETPTRGELRIGDRVVNALPPQERNVAMVFQDYALYPNRTVRGNLAFPLEMRRMARDEVGRRIDAVAALLEIGELLDRLPRELSGGQRQRVAMGRALVREPAVFLLDEPLSNLDAKLRVQVRAEIAELRRRARTTMLYVTHDQVEAMTLGDRVAVMRQGRLQQLASPRELYAKPANAFVAGFIGSPPMNLVPASLAAAGGGRTALELAGTLLPLPDALAAAARAAGGSDLTAGFRPEALRVATGASASALAAQVEHVEYLGHEVLAHLLLGPHRIVARLPEIRPAPGSQLSLELDPASLHLFAKNGDAVGTGSTNQLAAPGGSKLIS